MRDRLAVVYARSIVIDGLLCLACRRRDQKKNRIAEDDGRRMAFAWQGEFPADVVRLTPVDGRIGARRNSVRQRPAPLRPVVQVNIAGSANAITAQNGCGREKAKKKEKRRQGHAEALCTLDYKLSKPTF